MKEYLDEHSNENNEKVKSTDNTIDKSNRSLTKSVKANSSNSDNNDTADDTIRTNSKHKKKSKVDKHGDLKIKSYIGKVIYLRSREGTKLPIFIISLIAGFILDALRILKNLILTLFIFIVVVTVVAGLLVWKKGEPRYNEYNKFANEVVSKADYNTFKLQESSYIYDADGKLLVKLRADKDSSYLAYNEIPSTFVNAFIAVEDRTFWDNPGIDFKGIARAVYKYVKSEGDETHGASTITQQLARNIFLTHEVSLERKGKEMLIALKLTSKFTKEEIMEFYCNDICFANAYYGISSAAKGYFNKNVKDLSLSQVAYLCAIPNSPEYYNPYKHPERAIDRRNKILRDMCSQGMISKNERDKAIGEKINIEKPTYEFNDSLSTYATDCAIRYLMQLNGFKFRYKFTDTADYNSYYSKYDESYASAKNKLYTGGYKVYTSLSKEVQSNLQNILDEQLSFSEDKDESTGIYNFQGAVTAIDNETGKVIAVVGGRSQDTASQTYSLNRAFQAYRQPGSSIKPLVVYTPALMNGYTPNTTAHNISIPAAKVKGVAVQSLTGRSMSLRRALEQSKNGVAWQIFDKFGADYMLSFLNQMNFSKICPDDYTDAASLGGLTYGASTVEMAGAYSTIQNHGIYRGTTCLTSIKDRDGNEIYKDQDEVRVYKASAADTVVDMMKGVLTVGTAKGIRWNMSSKIVAAGKTGTTNNNKDAWFCGFTPYYTVTVWCGFDTPKRMANLQGATYPARIWKDAMLKLTEGLEQISDFSKVDYSDETDDLSNINIADDLPEDAYSKYLPGRPDVEELSSGYTVYDYRKDRVIGESVDVIIAQINATQPSDISILHNLYNEGCSIINTIYSVKFTNEKQRQLDAAYNAKQINIQTP